MIYFLATLGFTHSIYTLWRNRPRSVVHIANPGFVAAIFLIFWFYPKCYDLIENHAFSEQGLIVFFIANLIFQISFFVGVDHSSLLQRTAYPATGNNTDFIEKSWAFYSIPLFLVGLIAFYLYSRMPDDELYSRHPSGFITILIFLSFFLNLATYIFVFLYTKFRSFFYIYPILAGLILFADRILIHGKRMELVRLLFLVVVVGFMQIRTMKTFLVAGLLTILLIMLNYSAHEYRKNMKQAERDIESTLNINFLERLTNAAFIADYDIRNALATVDACSYRSEYFWGAEYWNYLVHRLVPGQFLGSEFKQSLMFESRDVLWDHLGFRKRTGTVVFYVGGLFANFSYAGAIIAFLHGFLLRDLYAKALERKVKDLLLYQVFGSMIPIVFIFGYGYLVVDLVLYLPLILALDIFVHRGDVSVNS